MGYHIFLSYFLFNTNHVCIFLSMYYKCTYTIFLDWKKTSFNIINTVIFPKSSILLEIF